MEKPVLILNNSMTESNYLSKIKHFQDELFPHIKVLLSSKTKENLLPIVNYFYFSLNQLNSILTDFRNMFETKTPFDANPYFINENDKFVFEMHVKKMQEDFRINGHETEANSIDIMLDKCWILPRYINLKLGVVYFEKLEELIFKPLIWAFTNNLKTRTFYEELLIKSRKLEYLVRDIFKIHLTSFYDIFAKYSVTDSEWENIRKNMEVIVI